MLRTFQLGFLGLLVASFLAPTTASALSRRRGITIICAEPEKKDMEGYTDVFEATLDGIDIVPANKSRSYRLAEQHYAFRFAIQRRFKGDLEGVVEVVRFGQRLPSQVDGARYLVFAERYEGRPYLPVCALLEGDEVETWLRKTAQPGEDVSGRIKAKRRKGSAPEIERWRKKVADMQWEERLRNTLSQELGELRKRLEARDEESALQLWMLVRRRTEAAHRSAGRVSARAPAPQLVPKLSTSLTELLLAKAGVARGRMEFGQARKRWGQALLVLPGHPEAKRGLAALDATANKVFQEAYDSRKTHPTLARAGLREVIRMTAASSELQGRARQLLVKLEAKKP